jgi:hypothetical protein
MPWVRFVSGFDWKPRPQLTIAYRAGQVANVTTPCAAKAVATGKATRLPRARKTDAHQG